MARWINFSAVLLRFLIVALQSRLGWRRIFPSGYGAPISRRRSPEVIKAFPLGAAAPDSRLENFPWRVAR